MRLRKKRRKRDNRKRKYQKDINRLGAEVLATICLAILEKGFALSEYEIIAQTTFYRSDITYEDILIDFLDVHYNPFIVAIEKGCPQYDKIKEKLRVIATPERQIICLRNVPAVMFEYLSTLPKITPNLN